MFKFYPKTRKIDESVERLNKKNQPEEITSFGFQSNQRR